MDALLRLKHWQVFLVISVPVAGAVAQFMMLTNIRFEDMARYDLMMNVTTYIVMAGGLAITAWVYIVGVKLWEKVAPEGVDTRTFKVFIGYDVLYTILVQVLPENRALDLISWIAWGYTYYFIARMLVSAERGRLVTFGESVREFIALLFLWISIWWIQPRINKVFDSDWDLNVDAPLDHNLDQQRQS